MYANGLIHSSLNVQYSRYFDNASFLADKAADFIRIIEALLKKSEKGDFDEPLPEIPFIGICNRVNCGDIYKAIDEFRKSEFFTNFQVILRCKSNLYYVIFLDGVILDA